MKRPRAALAVAIFLVATALTHAIAAGPRPVPPRTESHSYLGSTPTGVGGVTIPDAPGGAIYISVVAFDLKASDQFASAKVVDQLGLEVGGNVYFASSTNAAVGPVKAFCGNTPKLAVPRYATQFVVQVKADVCAAPAVSGSISATFQQYQPKPKPKPKR